MLSAIRERLDQISGLHFQGYAAELAAVDKSPPQRKPAYYLVPLSDDATPNQIATGIIRQEVTESFAVVVAVDSVAHATGPVEKMAAIKHDVIDALVGFQPTDEYEQIEYRRFRLMALKNATAWGEIAFVTSYQLRKSA